MFNFHPYGPFPLPKSATKRRIDKDSQGDFWLSIDTKYNDLSYAVGCYIFSIRRRGGGWLPWYVGRTNKNFRKECFYGHKLEHFNSALDENSGTPLLTLIAKLTPGGNFANPSNRQMDVEFLEKHLIALAIRCNPELKNKKDTRFLREIVVPGILNTPSALQPAVRQRSSVSKLEKLLKL